MSHERGYHPVAGLSSCGTVLPCVYTTFGSDYHVAPEKQPEPLRVTDAVIVKYNFRYFCLSKLPHVEDWTYVNLVFVERA